MNILEFILGVLVIIVVLIIGIGAICMHYNIEKVEEENKKLREELRKLRERKIKKEYKKVSNIGEDK